MLSWWWIQRLHAGNPVSRRVAAERLGRAGGGRSVAELEHALESDDDWSVRRAAACALERLGDAHAVPALSRALLQHTPRESSAAAQAREAAGLALVRFGDAGLARLREALHSRDAPVRAVAAAALGASGRPEVVPLLRALIAADSGEAGSAAARALAALGWTPASLEDRVHSALATGDDSALQRAAADTTAVPVLLDAMRRHTGGGRRRAAQALARLSWSTSNEEERLLMADALDDVAALGRLGPAAAGALRRVMDENAPSALAADAARALGRIGGEPAVAALSQALKAREPLGPAALEALLESPDAGSGAALAAAMAGGGPLASRARDVARRMAGREGPKRDALVRLLDGRDDDLASTAAAALAEAGWRPTDPGENARFLVAAVRFEEAAALGEVAAAPLGRAAGHPASGYRRAVVEAVGRGRGEWAASLLRGRLHDPVYAVRKAAALGLRAQGETVPEPGRTPGACAYCGERLASFGPVSDDMIGRVMVSQGAEAANELLRATCTCPGCGLALCYPCFKYGKYRCLECGTQL